MTLGDYARMGQFMLDGGVTQGPADPAGRLDRPGNTVRITNGVPPPTPGTDISGGSARAAPTRRRAFFGQSISIIPAERLVIVINSAWPSAVGRELFIARSSPSSTRFRRERQSTLTPYARSRPIRRTSSFSR
jgi:CubicO group peptidase (beta-lactamase class C family)